MGQFSLKVLIKSLAGKSLIHFSTKMIKIIVQNCLSLHKDRTTWIEASAFEQ